MVGSGGAAPQLSRVYIAYSSAYTVRRPRLLSTLRRDLQAKGTELVDNEKQASAVLKIYSVGPSERIAAIGSNGFAKEYELTEHVRFGLIHNGKTIVAPTTLSRSQDYTYTTTALQATSQERERLQQQLQDDLAEAVLRHIDIVLSSGRTPVHHGQGDSTN